MDGEEEEVTNSKLTGHRGTQLGTYCTLAMLHGRGSFVRCKVRARWVILRINLSGPTRLETCLTGELAARSVTYPHSRTGRLLIIAVT